MIVKQEIKKLCAHPMMWCLLILCFFVNLLLLWSSLNECYKELPKVHDAILQQGVEEEFYQERLSIYDTLDMVQIKEMKEEMLDYHPKGSYKRFIDQRYKRLNQRVRDIVKDGEAEQLIYPGIVYRLHHHLYVKLLRWILLEMAVLMAFCVLYLMDYERIQRTMDIVYTSSVGRRLQYIKWGSGIMAGLGFGMVLMLATLAVWFSLVPYQGFFGVSMSAALMAEPRGILLYPFITFRKLTVLQYLLLTLIVGVLLVIIVGILTGVFQLFLKNSYLSFLMEVILLLGCIALWGQSSTSWFDVAATWNPAVLWWRVGTWFMEGDVGTSFEGMEVISILVQGLLYGCLGRIGYKRFLVSDC